MSLMTRRGPLVVWLDDVQWGLDAIECTLRSMKGEPFPVLFVLTVRDDALSERDLEAEALQSLRTHSACSSTAAARNAAVCGHNRERNAENW